MSTKKYFDNSDVAVSDPFTKRQTTPKRLFVGDGLLNKEYLFGNETTLFVLNKIITECPQLLYPYAKTSSLDANALHLLLDEEMFVHIIRRYEYHFYVNNRGELLLTTKTFSENQNRFSFIFNVFSNFIVSGGLAHYIKSDKIAFEHILSKTNNLLGYPEYVIETYCTNELCSLEFREFKSKEIQSIKISEASLRLDDFDLFPQQFAYFKISFTISLSPNIYYLNVKEYFLQAQIQKFTNANAVMLKIAKESLDKIHISLNTTVIKYENEYFTHGKKYCTNLSNHYTLIDIIKKDPDYITWLMKNHNNFIIKNIESYFTYLIPFTDIMICAIIYNQFKSKLHDDFISMSEDENSADDSDIRWMNDAAFEFDNDNYWNID